MGATEPTCLSAHLNTAQIGRHYFSGNCITSVNIAANALPNLPCGNGFQEDFFRRTFHAWNVAGISERMITVAIT